MKKEIPQHVIEKRLELLYAISLQGYTMSEIAFIFGMPKSTAHKYISQRPVGWTAKWRKIE